MRAWWIAAVAASVALGAGCDPLPRGLAYTSGSTGSGSGGGAGSGGAPNPFRAPEACASQSLWSGEDTKDMLPGGACLTCHGAGEGTAFVVAGSVFTTGHVPDACEATFAQQAELGLAEVLIEDAAGVVLTLHVWPSGNFMQKETAPALTFPITAWVAYQGAERRMEAAQMSGDCNGCHTEQGASGAPGRIVLP